MNDLKGFDRFLKGWIYYLPLLVCVLLMLPRLASPQFGLFDDGKTITAAKEMAKDITYFTFEADQGRFRPVYWLYSSLIYWVFGLKPFWFFLGNTIVLILSTWMLMSFTQMVTGKRFQAWTAGLLFALSGPVIESFYTLSKGEPLQVALLLLAMLSSAWMFQTTIIWKRLLFGLLGMLSVFSAILVKETSIVMIPVSLGWLFLAWLRQRKNTLSGRQSGWGVKATTALAVFSIFSSGLFLLLRRMMITTVLTGGTYTNDYSLQIQTILSSLVRWAGWSIRDFIFILPLLLLVIVWQSAKRKSLDRGFILEALVWMGGWAGIYLPWFFMTEYYMLPFAAGMAIFTAALLDISRTALLELATEMRRWVIACLVAAGLLFGMTLFNNASNAGIQLVVDAANAKMLANVVEFAPQDSFLMMNFQDYNEYCQQIAIFTNSILGRSDVKLEMFFLQPPRSRANGASGYNLMITPVVRNQPILSVRMGVVEPTQQIWNSVLENYMVHEDWQMISSSEYTFPLVVFDFSRVFCPLLNGQNFCERQAPLVDTRTFSYGWRIYSLYLP
jgi:hypothetical protein